VMPSRAYVQSLVDSRGAPKQRRVISAQGRGA
jgi:hypothetical protein